MAGKTTITNSKLTIYHPAAFVLTFLSYAMFHAIRKTTSNVKSTLVEEWTPCNNGLHVNHTETEGWYPLCTPEPSWNRPGGQGFGRGSDSASFFPKREEAEEFLGMLDSSFLFAYAAGMYVSGAIADRSDLRLLLSFGIVSTAAVTFVFGPALAWTSASSKPAYVVLMVASGFLQSTGWPCVVAVMGNWFSKGSRGFVLGLWSACQSVGNILGALMAAAVVDYGYEYAFLLNSCVLFAAGVVVFFGLVPTPQEVGLDLEEEEGDQNSDGSCVKDAFPTQIDPGTTSESCVQIFTMNDNHKNFVVRSHSANMYSGRPTCTCICKRYPNHASVMACGCKCPRGDENDTGVEHSDLPKKSEKDSGVDSSILANESTRSAQCLEIDGGQQPAQHAAACSSSRGKAGIGHLRSGELAAGGVKSEDRPKAIGFLSAFLLPGVLAYSLAYAFLKLVNYAFFFWLPFYLSAAFNWRQVEADQLSTWYDVGGIVGGTVAGFISDRCGRKAVVVVPMLVLAVPTLHVYGNVRFGDTRVTNAAMLTCTGFFIGGAANLISAAVAADLGRQEALRGNAEAISTVTGIVDGTGSLGAAIGLVAVPYLQVAFGWQSVFYLFMVAIVATNLCILPILVGEVKQIVQHHRQRRQQPQQQHHRQSMDDEKEQTYL